MPRHVKYTADYFPHVAHHGKTMFILESKFGNDGYAFWFKLLELLCSTEGHCYDCDSAENWGFLTSVMHVNDETATEILDLLAKLGAIDSDLWDDKRIWSQHLVDNLSPLYAKRTTEIPQKPHNRGENAVSGVGNTQSKGSIGSKVKEVKEVKGEQSSSSQNTKPETLQNIDNEHLRLKKLRAEAEYYKIHDEKAYLTFLKQHPEIEEEVPW